jgi:hypothetical protein
MAGRLLKMEDIERDHHRVVNLSEKNIELSELMNNVYLERSNALNEVFSCWSKFGKVKTNLSKVEKRFKKGEIGECEYQQCADEFYYRKRCAKRASRRYKDANIEIRKLRQEKEEIKRSLSSRIFSEYDWNST